MIVIEILEGYSRSVSPVDFSDLVMLNFTQHKTEPLIKKAWFGNHQVRRFTKFAQKNQGYGNVLFLAGKSLGGRNIIRVYNRLMKYHHLTVEQSLQYKAVVLFTVDVNYPTFKDWTPNLNHVWLILNQTPTRGANVYLREANKRKQAGARVSDVENLAVVGETHQSITGCTTVQDKVKRLAEFAIWCDTH